ncbi:UDP-glycosyltransferase UGT4-like [Adelges cooleyi]|uniref:UDP-glycosyltransferase UGT4-like n=1 Tax=Adelges cooleyi TaxID=133065 RepID=UPI00218032EF|nr:UDP-glycosyltransferase UGT4-like [Adelges cooleyi]
MNALAFHLIAAWLAFAWHGTPEVRASNILAFLPTETHSHFNGFKPLLRELVKRGHNLTLVSPFSLGNDLLYTHIEVEKHYLEKKINHMDRSRLLNKLPVVVYVLWLGPKITKIALDRNAVKNFIRNDGSSFDLVLFENFFTESCVTIGHKYGAPVVQLLPFNTNPRVSQWHGNPYNPAYIPEFTSNFPTGMSFVQRLGNTALAFFSTCMYRLVSIPQHRAIMDSYFDYPGHEGRPDLTDMLRNVSLTVYMSNPVLGTVSPTVPNFIPMAGTHTTPAKQLPQDLKEIVDGAKNGVVFFSMGSVIQASKMPNETVSLLLSELGKIKQTVLWKWEDDSIPDLPKNVIVRKWFPQNDVLGHPNCRLFITHGGIHSMIETIYHGVPVLCLSVFGDQAQNCIQAKSKGFAEYIPFFELTSKAFGDNLRSLLDDSRYKVNAQKSSAILKDNPISLMDNVVFWIEYVIRHKGAHHLKTAANDIYWFQFLLLDVVAFVSLLSTVFVYISFKCFRCTFRKCLKRKNNKISSEKKVQ